MNCHVSDVITDESIRVSENWETKSPFFFPTGLWGKGKET